MEIDLKIRRVVENFYLSLKSYPRLAEPSKPKSEEPFLNRYLVKIHSL